MNKELIKQLINATSFISATFSEIEKNSKSEFKKINIRKVFLDKKEIFQMESFKNRQVFHKNISLDFINNNLESLLENYRQLLIKDENADYQFLKHGDKFKVHTEEKNNKSTSLNLNRKKQYILNEGDNIPFLIELGVMSSNRLVRANMQHKFRQINRYLEFIRDIVDVLPKDQEIQIVDFGCGKSYLTFALYHYLHNILNLKVIVNGLDLKKDVIEECSALAKKLHFDNLTFSLGDIANYNANKKIDMVVTLHACDTATDYALFQAIRWNAKIILSVPCCQHEINKTIKNDELSFAFKYGIIKEKMSSLLTDALRGEILNRVGYKSQILEFIDTEHTPKNLLIRAIKTNENIKGIGDIENFCMGNNINPTLLKLVKKEYYNE